MKDISYRLARQEKGLANDKPNFQKNERPPRLQYHPYNTNWYNGKPIQNNQKNTQSKVPPDPLHKNSMNFTDETPWCVVFQLPHASQTCSVARQFEEEQNQSDDYEPLEENDVAEL